MYSSSGVSSTGSLLLSGEDGSGGLIGGPLGPTGGLIALESYLGQHPFPQQTIVINGIDPFEDDPIQVCVSTLTSPKHYTTLNIVFRRPYLKTRRPACREYTLLHINSIFLFLTIAGRGRRLRGRRDASASSSDSSETTVPTRIYRRAAWITDQDRHLWGEDLANADQTLACIALFIKMRPFLP